MLKQAKSIAKGHYNELLNKEQELSTKRLLVCHKCPLFIKTMFGEMCDPKKYLDPKTNEVSIIAREGFFKGCGCRLEAKTRTPNESCPAGKWKNVN
jgi:hypothetical protein